MVKVKRHERMTEADKIRKVEQQRRRRLLKPSVSGQIRKLLGSDDLYWELYNQFMEDQGGKCAICQKLPGEKRRFHMDHDHETLEVRGLLCFSCNSKLGFVEKYFDMILRYLGYERVKPC